MIGLDANILLYGWDSTSLLHQTARHWLERTFSGTVPVGIPWQTTGAFLRITTNNRLPGERLTVAEAVEIIDGWVDHPPSMERDGWNSLSHTGKAQQLSVPQHFITAPVSLSLETCYRRASAPKARLSKFGAVYPRLFRKSMRAPTCSPSRGL